MMVGLFSSLKRFTPELSFWNKAYSGEALDKTEHSQSRAGLPKICQQKNLRKIGNLSELVRKTESGQPNK